DGYRCDQALLCVAEGPFAPVASCALSGARGPAWPAAIALFAAVAALRRRIVFQRKACSRVSAGVTATNGPYSRSRARNPWPGAREGQHAAELRPQPQGPHAPERHAIAHPEADERPAQEQRVVHAVRSRGGGAGRAEGLIELAREFAADLKISRGHLERHARR